MPTDPELHSHLRTLEESHLRPEVRSSPEALGALLAEDFLEFGSSGRVWDRQVILEDVPDEAPFRWSMEDFAVRLLAPGVALTTYRLSVGSVEGTDVRTTLRSSVWVQRGGRWVMIFHQGTPVAVH
jgi:hypothetical protein